MPAWLTWKAFWKVAPYIAILLAIGGAVLYIDHKGYERAENKYNQQKLLDDNRNLKLQQYLDQRIKDVQLDLQDLVGQFDTRLHGQLQGLDLKNNTVVQPTLIKEIHSEARYSDPNGMSVGVWSALNAARSEQVDTCVAIPDGGISCRVSAGEPSDGSPVGNSIY